MHPDNKVPWVVHCSAGIGRTGTMIAIDHGMHLLRNTGRADTLEIIAKLRRCRGGMVQHPVQAEFVHQTLARYALLYLLAPFCAMGKNRLCVLDRRCALTSQW